MNWFRFYSEVVHDPKVQNLPEVLFKTWVNLLCLACLNDGTLPTIADISYHLRITESRAAKAVKALIDAGLVDTEGQHLQPHNWHGRQFSSDHSRNRVAAFRERSRNAECNVTPPLQKQECNGVEQNRTEQIQNRTDKLHAQILPDQPPIRHIEPSQKAETERWFTEEFWPAYPLHKAKAAALKAARSLKTQEHRDTVMIGLKRQLPEMKANPGFIPHASTWINGRRWEDEPQLALTVSTARPVDRFDRHAQRVTETFHELIEGRLRNAQ